jgi:hypothetical protein
MEFPILEELQLPLNDLREADIIIGEQHSNRFLGFLWCQCVHNQ